MSITKRGTLSIDNFSNLNDSSDGGFGTHMEFSGAWTSAEHLICERFDIGHNAGVGPENAKMAPGDCLFDTTKTWVMSEISCAEPFDAVPPSGARRAE
jgi:hypothetical protein